MTVVPIDADQTELSSLVARAQAGEEIVLTKGEHTVARIVPAQAVETTKRLWGGYKGLISYDDDIFKPLSDQEMKDYGFE